MTEWKFYIATFGCKVNQYESQALREAWERLGGVETDRPEDANYLLINSCAITARAERNARNAVFKLKQLAPGAKIILSGCAAQFYGNFKARKNANWAMPDRCIPQLRKQELLAGPEPGLATAERLIAISAYRRSRPVIKIQDGCSQNCSYCIVPQTRGRPRSRPRAQILAECRALAEKGHSELVLSGVNLRQYYAEGDFWDLLAWLDRELAPEFNGKMRLRISSIDPAMLNSRSLEILASCSLCCPQLHLSLQHASPQILQAMRRGHYTPEFLLASCKSLAQIWPIFGLGADIITGFPGESEADLKMLLDFISCLPLTYAHVFPYSRRQGSGAAAMAGQIPRSLKEERAWRVREIVTNKKKNFLRAQQKLNIMCIAPDAPGGESGKGVNEYYVPCIFEWPREIDNSRKLLMGVPDGIFGEGIKVRIMDS